MNKRESALQSKIPWLKRYRGVIVAALNIMLLAGAFTMYTLYTDAYDDRLREENLGNISNLNRSAVINATALFDSWEIKLCDIVQYAESHDLTRDGALQMISDTNSSRDRYFELIGSDHKGFLARQKEDGTFPVLDYTHSSYSALHKVFDQTESGASGEINFAPEYTDSGETAARFFAIYKHLSLKNEEGEPEPYTLLLAASARSVLQLLNGQGDYEGQSTVLIDASGNYIVSSKDYKSTNFFQYLYVYNELTLDQRNAIQREMEEKGEGELYYKNGGIVVEDCVFRYEKMTLGGWYCVTCVPLTSFHAPAFDIKYIIYALLFLLMVFVIDLIWLQGMNSRLRASVQREKEASAAKGNFMSRMSHEIRTPLNAVIGYNTIARDEMIAARDDASRRQAEMKVMDCLSKSEIASKHLLTIINDVLDMSAIESGKIKVAHDRFDFKGLITSLTTVFYSQAKTKEVDFEVVFDTLTEEWFVGDQMRTNQILTNLLSNAIKFTSPGGSVTLRITQPESRDHLAHIHFNVSDTGIGMTAEYLSHIWTPFEQADSSISRRFGGTGLGLAITKNLVDLMGGEITVQSVPGEGTTFSVDLAFEHAEQPSESETYDFSAVNALVVDDDSSTCEYIRLLFNRCKARCAAVTSGADAIKALALARDRHDDYTICLVDWRMPEMDGIETARRIRQVVGNDMPIIVLTAYDYAELADRAAEVGVNRLISKPLFQSTLLDLLSSYTIAHPAAKPAKKRDVNFKGERVLLAEDNAMNMEIAKNILQSAGLIVDGAWNGREAVRMFKSSLPGTYMAILMDVHMPEMNGHEATRVIRASEHPDAKSIPIIAMTADAFAENVAEAHAAGMNDHIAKPIDVPLLFSTLKKYVR